MNNRNIVWLVAIAVVGAVAWIAVAWWLGLVAAGVTLVVSEVVERAARKRRRAASGDDSTPSIRDAFGNRRNR
jgi:hypothetical protein